MDAVHSDVVQMATTMGRAETNRKKKGNDDDGTAPDDAGDMDNDDDGPQESQVLKKLKKKSRKVQPCFFSSIVVLISTVCVCDFTPNISDCLFSIPNFFLFQHKSSLADKPESLLRKQKVFQTMNPFLVRLSANLSVSQSGECPFHHSLKYRESSSDFEAKDNCDEGKDGKSLQDSTLARGLVPLPALPGLCS